MIKKDVIIIGAGASGLMCAIEAGKRKENVLVIDHQKKAGQKILASGGGRCNFTNKYLSADNYASRNNHFCKSAINQYTQYDFIEFLKSKKISFSEKNHGQLFCNTGSEDILKALISECEKVGVNFQLGSSIKKVRCLGEKHFAVESEQGVFHCASLVIATGALSMPKIGATSFGYKIAEQFGINVITPRAGLVPLVFTKPDRERFSALSGISAYAEVSVDSKSFLENILFTHRGLSGPAILQLSSYWEIGKTITINLLPDIDLFDILKKEQLKRSKRKLKTVLCEFLPKRLISVFILDKRVESPLCERSDKFLNEVVRSLKRWVVKPHGTEGYRTAEITLGGVDCNVISSKTFESKNVKGLYFIGEVLDVAGQLGGFNLQWAWSSGWCAGQYI
ncbi:MAG: NAD(P)/FAD-dependent oxidoreductase [Candidatus Zapsychrus exili]|nr:NAD(P)/FAD-dependent oxidoreductase [Candidatus Zapsychrus exili]